MSCDGTAEFDRLHPAASTSLTTRCKWHRFRVLDECDEMLNMGFVDDVEKILSAVEKGASVQTLLFSATLPKWVKEITARFLKPGHKTVDLVGTEKMKVCRHTAGITCTESIRA